jgi:uncharacterized protein (TIGR03083 family)
MAPARVRAATLAELDRLRALVQDISIDDWSKPSAAAPWTIGDVVAHLNLAMGAYGRVMDAVLAGKGSGSLWKAVGQVTRTVAGSSRAAPAFHALNRALPHVIDRALSPEVIKAQFAAGARTLHDRLGRVESNDYTRPVYWFGGPWPLSFFLAMVENELAIHGWDVASRIRADEAQGGVPSGPGRPRPYTEAHLSEDARSVLPWFYWSGSPLMLFPHARELTGTIQASLTDPAAEMWWSLAGTDRRQGLGASAKPDTTITGASGTFVLALAGRIPAADALRTTSLQVQGNEELARRFLASWRIV